MPQHTIVLKQSSSKPVAELYARLADHNQLSPLLGAPVKRIVDGSGDINGVGSVRRIGLGPLAIEETVVAAEAAKRIEYKITRGGFPIRHHHGRLDFANAGSGSQVTWTIEFDSALPVVGSLVKTVLGTVIGRGLRKLA